MEKLQLTLTRPRRNSLFLVLLVLAAIWAWSSLTLSYTPSPRNLDDFRKLETRIQGVKEKAVPAVVAVQCPNTSTIPGGPLYASGAIVSRDGLIVSSFHVSHRLPWDGVATIEHLNAGDMTTVILADGTECKAELLGADQTLDISLLKLVEPGPYPFLNIAKKTKLDLGDWVIELGHPTGLLRNRPPVVRIGRVVVREPEFFVSDCNITGGDSGGPIVDLDGEIVGIPAALVADERFFGQSHFVWARNKSGTPILYSATPAHEFLKKWDAMLDGQILPYQEEKYRMYNLIQNAKPILPESVWTRGREVKDSFTFSKREPCSWVVNILDSNGKQVSLGTICTSDGTVVTLSSKLSDSPRCQLHDGTIIDCKIIRKDKKLNLAILKLPLKNASTVRWGMEANGAAVGRFVAAPLGDASSFNVGIASTPKLAPTRGIAHDYFEVDMHLTSESCGGPIVNSDFETVGISVGSHTYGTYAMPAAQVVSLLDGIQE